MLIPQSVSAGPRSLVCSLFLLWASLSPPSSPAPAQESDAPLLLGDERLKALEEVAGLLEQHYVFPEVAEEIVALLKANVLDGRYDELTTESAFCKRVTEDLRSVNGDRHLMLYPAPRENVSPDSNYEAELWAARGRGGNHGFAEVEILPGNVGYLRLSSFSLDQMYDEACRSATAAMTFLRDADALIIDLRDNPGGGARLTRFLASWFFEEEPVHLNDYYFRSDDRTLEYWTLRELPGERRPDLELLILINEHTFSAAEGFAYNLKHLGRATVVGEPSGGGSHGGRTFHASERFRVFIPFSRSVHPVTKTDFEGIGVQPTVSAGTKEALDVAFPLALEACVENGTLTKERARALAAQGRPKPARPYPGR